MNEPNRGQTRLEQVGFVFLLIWALGAYHFFLKGLAANENQQMFRVGVFAVGAIGTIVVAVLKMRQPK